MSTYDYGERSDIFIFSTCQHKSCQEIVIVDNKTVERNETFVIHLSRTLGLDERIILDPSAELLKLQS